MTLDVIQNAIWFLVAVFVLVTFHEFGHFAVGRLFGVGVVKFAIGFGRPLVRWRPAKSGTEYSIGILPLGGYVKFVDEREDKVPEDRIRQAFNRQTLAVRSAVVVAGPVANFLLAFLLYWLAFGIGVTGVQPVVGEILSDSAAESLGISIGDTLVAIDGRAVRSWGEHRYYLLDRVRQRAVVELEASTIQGGRKVVRIDTGRFATDRIQPFVLESIVGILPLIPPVIGEIVPDHPAAEAGLQVGDRILAIDGRAVRGWRDVVEMVSGKPGRDTVFVIQRGESELTFSAKPKAVETNGERIGRVGIAPSGSTAGVHVRFGLVESFSRALENTWFMGRLTIQMIVMMAFGEESTRNLGGPLSIAKYAGTSAGFGIVPFLMFLAILSISLGILNLLPIPVLDGGHLVYFLIEAVKGSPVSDVVMYWGQQIGFGIIAVLIGLALYNDVLNIFG